MPDFVNLTLTEDDDESASFRITDDAGDALGLTGADVFAVIKASQAVEDDASTGVFTLTEGDGVTIDDAANGLITLTFPSGVTESPGVWFYKIRVSRGSPSATKTAIEGWLSVADS
ncbi:hypothetical protein FH608_046175 [Nonomuraea phyllanthi]|uniref:BppU N-terminal domain-containing protein n=1 Tax=Nonomuraea phyllanthi TaxID=2219224 RepID=A0A5C4V694_9ACTN|nr:hypothetical protein [Nonomuraea phyllanthi]KAB8186882.1 hypothetical protein FH608_046175 [Nonomuraea phyllanthi]